VEVYPQPETSEETSKAIRDSALHHDNRFSLAAPAILLHAPVLEGSRGAGVHGRIGFPMQHNLGDIFRWLGLIFGSVINVEDRLTYFRKMKPKTDETTLAADA